jgi:hypothetical protein
MKRLLAVLLSVMSSATLAQTTATVNPSTPAQSSVNDDVPPGGCMPIGLTTSGEIVFPIQCKEFIERHREMPVEQKPAAVEEKTAAKQSEAVAPESSIPANKPAVVDRPAVVEEKPAAKQLEAARPSEEVAPENSKPATRPVEAVPLPKRAEHPPRERVSSSNSCQHYRTYNPASGTYRGFDGRVRPCR